MKKNILLLSLFFTYFVKGQVGINTTDPKSTFEVVGQPTNSSATDGFIPPKLQRSQLIAKTGYGTDQTGAVVYVTDTSGATNTATAKVTSIGYYFWDGDSWEPIGNSGDGRNIYTENGTLNGNRTVAQTTNNLNFTSTATTGTSHFTVDGSTFNVNAVANNVGIGTSTPSGRLHVASDDGRDAVFSMGSNDATTNMDLDVYRYRGNASSPTVVQNGDNIGGLRFSGLNGAASGVVAPFTIMGEVNAVADGVITPTSAPGALNFRTTNDGTLTSSTKMTIKNNGNVGIGTTDPRSTLDVNGSIINRETNFTVASNAVNINTPTSLANIVGSATATISVSSFTPTINGYRLIVSNNTSGGFSATFASVTIPNGQSIEFIFTNSAWRSTIGGSAASTTIYNANGTLSGNRTVTQNSNTLAFTSSATNAFSVDGTTFSVDAANDRIGIGTTAPNLSLDVTTTTGIGLKASNTSPWDHLYFNAGTTSSTISAGGADSGLQFRVGNGASGTYGGQTYTTVATMMPNGNVGIGNTDPNAPLHFANTTANRKIVLLEGTNNDHQFYGLGVNNNTLRYQIRSTADNHIFFAGSGASSSNELMRIQGNGNVGIGTATPNGQLQLSNSIQNRKIVLNENANNDHQFFGFGINNNTLRYQIANSADNHIFYSGAGSAASNELVRIQGNGNVGIGATDPQQRLDVNGNVRIRGNNSIMYQNLADYRLVIREDYESAVTGWTNNTRTTYLGQNILGGFNVLSTATNQKTFDLTGIPHTTVKIKFSYYSIDSWDGETAYVRISGTGGGWNRVISFGEVTRENIVGGTWADGIYYGEIEVPHTGNSLTIIVGSSLNQTPDDESYGIDNLEIWVR